MTRLKEFKFFSIFNHEKEELYLRNKHKEGWKFLKVNGLGLYHFEKCMPEDVIYQLDYNQTEDKEQYIQMFNDYGWEYIQDYAQYSYFRKKADINNIEESIFCDDESRLEMLERVYKGRLLPLLVIFSSVLIPQFIFHIVNKRYVLSTFIGAILVIYLLLFTYSAIHYYKKKNG